MIEYEKVNQLLYKLTHSSEIEQEINNLNVIKYLAQMILENTPIQRIQSQPTFVPLQESLQTATDFFHEFNQDYEYIFQNFLQEKNTYQGYEDIGIRFFKIRKEGEALEVNGQSQTNNSMLFFEGNIRIDYSEEPMDIYSIVHESVHKLSLAKDSWTNFQNLFYEVPSLTSEFLLTDYLLDAKKYPENEIKILKNNRLQSLMTYAAYDMCFITLLEIYQKNGVVNEELIKTHISNLASNSITTRIFLQCMNAFLQSILSERLLLFDAERYIVGLTLACYMHQKIMDNPDKKEKLFQLIHLLGEPNYLEKETFLKAEQLDIPIIKDGQLYIDDQVLQNLYHSYGKEISSIAEIKKKETRTP